MDAELKQHLVEMEGRASVHEMAGRASVHEMAGRTLASARIRAISAALRAIDLERESFADLVSRLKGNQPE